MTQISKNFSLEELCASAKARELRIDNTPGVGSIVNLCALVHHVLQPCRDAVGFPIIISSGYRSSALNAALPGSSLTSQHLIGQAADLWADDEYKLKQIFTWIRSHCDYDQLIWETRDEGKTMWVHVSYRSTGGNRRQVLTKNL